MGQAKDLIAEDEQKWYAAIEIGVRSEVLRRCELCEEVTDQSDDGLEEAYKLGNALFTRKDDLVKYFKTRKELTDLIQSLPDEFNKRCRCQRQSVEND
jgi:hypothetical protein